jgi:8-oxo-dGTP diphosphatase
MRQLEVAAAVCVQDGEVFVAQRPDKGETARKWEFPGGKLEEGESGEEAVVREIKEELDTVISGKREIGTVSCQYQTFFLVMHLYLCTPIKGSFTLKEHLAKKWIGKEEAESLDWAEADRMALPLVLPCLAQATV